MNEPYAKNIEIINPPKPHVPESGVSAAEVTTPRNGVDANSKKMVTNISAMSATETVKYEKSLSSRVKRLYVQYQKLHAKGEYMGKMVTFGNKYGRNEKCPCKSGKKFKHCCIKNHDHNMWRLSRLQWAMETFKAKMERLGLKIGVHI